jgi:hypothetical protein
MEIYKRKTRKKSGFIPEIETTGANKIWEKNASIKNAT